MTTNDEHPAKFPDVTVPLGDVDTRTNIMKKWLQAALYNDAHVWFDRPYPGQRHRTIMVKGFGGATAEALRVNLYAHMAEVTVDVVGTWETTDPTDALSAMVYIKQRIQK